MAERTTEQNVASHRRLVTRAIIEGLRSVFNGSYIRERQFQNLKVTNTYPLQKVDYPAIVVEYENTLIANAGLAHAEWFPDANGVLRKWNHRRFEGTVNFSIVTLSPLDRDILADAFVEVISYGRLEDQAHQFFNRLYTTNDGTEDGNLNYTPVTLNFTQLMLNVDEIHGAGNSASIAPWQPEDVLVYETSYSLDIHGGYYNVVPQQTWGTVTRVNMDSYPQGDQTVTIPFSTNPNTPWTNPFVFDDADVVTGEAKITAVESFT